jgi:HK97 family phage prohead protease
MDLEQFLEAGLPEFRSVPFIDFEAKDDGWAFEGLAAVYGQEGDLGEFTEEFRHGAFRKPLATGDNTRLIYEHAPPHLPVLATIKGNTLSLKDDVKGLAVRGQIAHHYLGEAVRELIKRGDIVGMSPGMIVGRGNSEVTRRSDGRLHRAIKALMHLPEVSLTSDPVYSGTTAEMRSMRAFRMAESLEMSQHVLVGAYPQLEDRAATLEAGTGDEKVKAVACETCGEEPCACEAVKDETLTEDQAREREGLPAVESEQRSGVDSAQTEAAARRRRLQMMGLTLLG